MKVRNYTLLLASLAVATFAVGVGARVLLTPGNAADAIGEYVSQRFPDGAVDVCATAHNVVIAAKERDALAAAVESLDSTSVGMKMGIASNATHPTPKRVVVECAGKPGGSLVERRAIQVAGRPESEFRPLGGRFREVPGNIDLYVVVVPQADANSVGNGWQDRIQPYDYQFVSDTEFWHLNSALLIGEEELNDPALLRRMLVVAMGFERLPEYRPLIDGICIAKDDVLCGPEIGS